MNPYLFLIGCLLVLAPFVVLGIMNWRIRLDNPQL